MEFNYTGIHEAVVASLPPETPTIIGHFAVDGRPYGIEIAPPNFPEMPSVGQTFTMDFEKFKRDEDWITLGAVRTSTQVEISVVDEVASSDTSVVIDLALHSAEDEQQSA